MIMPQPASTRLATVFGGSGFVGRHIVRALARGGWRVRVATRRPDLAGFLQTLGAVGQIQCVQANLRYPQSIQAALHGSQAAVNATGIQSEHGRQNFEAVHVFGPREFAIAASATGVKSFVHVSGLGADSTAQSAYVASKGRGAEAVRQNFPAATILEPSVVFGPEDVFFNRFAALARILPVMPLFGGGTARLQPVFVGDVGSAVANALDLEAAKGQNYQLGGPEIFTLRQVIELTLRIVERRRILAPLPFGLSRLLAHSTEIASRLTLGLFPAALTTTRDQIELLRRDNVVSPEARATGFTLEGLGVGAQGVEAIVPAYLHRFRRSGQFESNPSG